MLANLGDTILTSIISDPIIGFINASGTSGPDLSQTLTNIDTGLTQLQNTLTILDGGVVQANQNIVPANTTTQVNTIRNMLYTLQGIVRDQKTLPATNAGLVLRISQLCQQIDATVTPIAQYIHDTMVQGTGTASAPLLVKWNSITSVLIDPVEAYKSDKSLSLYYQAALKNAIILLSWQKVNDQDSTRAGRAAANIATVANLLQDWDQKFEGASTAIIPQKARKWAQTFLPTLIPPSSSLGTNGTTHHS
ncbi:hypothetical protein ABW21_db0202521 [Orbilia brochopaga]|nr:hypothetical protein ABW21_db0202521 [Drechslerella brochopaga]